MSGTQRFLTSCLFVYTVLVFYLCLTPVVDSGGIKIWDKAAHAITYAVFSGALCLISANPRYLGMGILFYFIVGIVIECLQGATGYRDASWQDQVANTIGLLIGLITGKCAIWGFKILNAPKQAPQDTL